MIAKTPKPPYYAVIFTSIKTLKAEGYQVMAEKMMDAVTKMEGFLGVESARSDLGITVSYWSSLESIQNWKKQEDHQQAQQKGRESWYSNYTVRICKVEKEYSK